MISIATTITRDAEDDVSICVTGYVDTDSLNPEEGRCETVLVPSLLKGSPAHVKLTAILHSIQNGISTVLFWEHPEANRDNSLILPVEGRGFMDLSKISHGGLNNPRGEHNGNIVLEVSTSEPGKRYFMLTLEMSKQRK